MEQIDKYVESVYKHVGGNKEEIEALKYEMKNHLLQLIKELKSEGKSEEESTSIAINRFGEENQIENELIGIFKFVNKKAEKAFIVAFSFLLLAMISFFIFVIGTNLSIKQYTERNDEIFNIMSSYSENNIENTNENISTLFSKGKGKITYVALYRAPNGEDIWSRKFKDLEYGYPKDTQFKDLDNFSNYTGKQIITKTGIKYNVVIGRIPSAPIPMYIQNIGRSSLVWLCCFLISVIAWILIKVGVSVNVRQYWEEYSFTMFILGDVVVIYDEL